MFGFIVLSCSLSVIAAKVECNYTVKEAFNDEKSCNVYENNYKLEDGERFGICDELKDGMKKGDKRPILVLKK